MKFRKMYTPRPKPFSTTTLKTRVTTSSVINKKSTSAFERLTGRPKRTSLAPNATHLSSTLRCGLGSLASNSSSLVPSTLKPATPKTTTSSSHSTYSPSNSTKAKTPGTHPATSPNITTQKKSRHAPPAACKQKNLPSEQYSILPDSDTLSLESQLATESDTLDTLLKAEMQKLKAADLKPKSKRERKKEREQRSQQKSTKTKKQKPSSKGASVAAAELTPAEALALIKPPKKQRRKKKQINICPHCNSRQLVLKSAAYAAKHQDPLSQKNKLAKRAYYENPMSVNPPSKYMNAKQVNPGCVIAPILFLIGIVSRVFLLAVIGVFVAIATIKSIIVSATKSETRNPEYEFQMEQWKNSYICVSCGGTSLKSK